MQIDILALAGLRLDGRKCNEIRQIRCMMDVLAGSNGSVQYEQGLNKILVSVQGPQEPKRRSDAVHAENGFITCQFVNASYSSSERKKRKVGNKRGKEIENVVKKSFEEIVLLELYKRCEISIVVHVFETDGSLLCAVINAVTLALVHAGIALRHTLVACSVGMCRQSLYLDLTQNEQSQCTAFMPVAVNSGNNEIVYMQLDKRISVDMLTSVLESCIEGCAETRVVLERIIKEYLSAKEIP